MYSYTNFILQSSIAALNAKNRYGFPRPSIWSASAIGDRDEPQASASCKATRTGCVYVDQPERLKDMRRGAPPSSRSDEMCAAPSKGGPGESWKDPPGTHKNIIGFAIILFWILYPLIMHL